MATSVKRRCEVCGERPAGAGMCKLCHKSYMRYAFDTGAVIDVVIWAARRARRFEQRRAKRAAAPEKVATSVRYRPPTRLVF